MEEKVSIIVPIYNVEKYLRPCLESIIRQTYPHLEIILVDDGSPDNSGIICDEYANKDNRIHVIHQKNQGVTSARKQGVDYATGKWILFVDGDDELKPNAVYFFLTQAIENNAQMVISPQIRRKQNATFQIQFSINGNMTRDVFCKSISELKFNVGIGGKFWSKDLYYNGVLDTSNKIKNNEDYLMNLRLSKKLKRAFCNAYEGVYIANVHENSASHTKLPSENWLILYNELLLLSKEYGYYPLEFLIISIEQRLHTKEITLKDIQKIIEKISLPNEAPYYIRTMLQWIKNPNFFYKFSYIAARKYNKWKEVKQIYGNMH